MLKRIFYIICFIVFIQFIDGCKKDKVPYPEIVEQSKWEKLSGEYKVYDTLGNYLYDMNISHIHDSQNDTDSLHFENFDDNFDFSSKQLNFGSNVSPYFITIGPKDTIFDNEFKRWKILTLADTAYNTLINGTIKMKYRITNINYYLQDITPYCDTIKIQLAVKQ